MKRTYSGKIARPVSFLVEFFKLKDISNQRLLALGSAHKLFRERRRGLEA
jgi:hypothetical protein